MSYVIDEYPSMNIYDLASMIHKMRKEGLILEIEDVMGEIYELDCMYISPGKIRFELKGD